MAEPTVVCPQCKSEIKLTESLAAPLLESIKRDYEQRLAQKDADMAKREKTLHEHEAALQKQKESLDEQVAQKLRQEQTRIAAEEAKKAKLTLGDELDRKIKEINDLQEVLKQRDAKLADAQKAQADLIRKQRELDDAKRELELTVEKRVQANLATARDKAKKDAEEEMKLKVMEAEQTIASMQKQIEDLKRRAEQGSQQLQGEVQELEIESLLSARFPRDTIQPVPKGEFGGDILHRVMNPVGQQCGTILWESKRTKNWNDGWLPKLREDQRVDRKSTRLNSSHLGISYAVFCLSHTAPPHLHSFPTRRSSDLLLSARFPRDTIQPVPKGEFGGDILHRVMNPVGQQCGTILWESKRTKNWNDGWLPKLREDQRAAKADIPVRISQVLPRAVETSA